jgi:hypothetical protein
MFIVIVHKLCEFVLKQVENLILLQRIYISVHPPTSFFIKYQMFDERCSYNAKGGICVTSLLLEYYIWER